MTTKTAQRLPRKQRRDAILRAAARAFASHGYAQTSMDDIAEEAGVTKLILYRHFVSKQDLYAQVVESVASRVGAAISAGEERGEFYGLHARALLSVARADPEGFRLLWRHAAREREFAGRVESLRSEIVEYAGTRISGIVADPTFRRWAAEVILGFLVTSVLTWLDEGDPAHDDDFVLVCTRSLKALVGTWAEDRKILSAVLDVNTKPQGGSL